MTGRRTVPGLVLVLAALVAGCGGETPSEPLATTEVAMAKSTYHYACTLHRRDMDGDVIVR